MLNNTNELGELKSLLFEDEIDTFNKLEKQIEQLQLEANNIDEIVTKITPLLDDVLLERLSDKEGRTVKIYAEYLAKIITKGAKHNLPELSKALQPVLSPAIAKEIEDNQEKMVDALYPIMGGMISKYVTNAIQEMMEKINSKVEDGLSFGSYKRKMKAKVSGVSESELLLQESHYARIRSFFIIDKESSLLIAEEHIENQEIDDPHMVASMASAIKDFVNDWIVSNKESSEVQLLSYGNATLYIESAGSVYLIAFLESEPDHEQRREIQQFFAKIVKKYSTFFQRFDGNDDVQEIVEIKKEMQSFLNRQRMVMPMEQKKKSNFAKYLFFTIVVLLVSYLALMAKEKYERYKIEQHILEKTGEQVNIFKQNHTLHLRGHIKSIENYDAIEKLMRLEGYTAFINEMYLPPKAIDMKIEQHTDYLRQFQQIVIEKLNALDVQVADMKKKVRLVESKYKKSIQKLDEIHSIENVESYILQKLKKSFKDESLLNSEDGALDFGNSKLFAVGDSIPNEKALANLGMIFKKYIEVLMADEQSKAYIQSILIEAYTDSTGDSKLNKKLSLERATLIKKYLSSLDISKKYHLDNLIVAKGLGSQNLIYVNGIEDRDASRRIKIKALFDYRKMLERIKNTIND